MSDKKIVFTKPYERDFTLALEEYWARGFLDHLLPKLGLTSPFPVFEIFFVTEENLQIWEHTEAIEWMLDTLLELNKGGTAFIESVIAEYQPLLEQIQGFWAAGPTADIERLEAYVELIKVAAPLFSMWYYPGTDTRTPEDVMKLVMTLRTTDEFFARNDVYIKDCIVALGGKREHANLVLCEEFPHLPSSETLEARMNGVVSVDGKERFVMSLEQFAKEHPKYEFEGLFDAVDQVSEVKGQVAQKGMVTGRVRIVKNKMQMTNVTDGDILVSPMTTPDFLSAMHRAAAFVTDEGGIMCHAAIVARELKKPCVIGAKIATKVFKDGDMVEVDAEKGIVRKL
ncbi:MAG: pyruvate, water dikinase [Parcubacteria bacterium C7867-004]|nr:MAG: pyruvate, water dikinase [Parcubacteria bacterium C7867-004]